MLAVVVARGLVVGPSMRPRPGEQLAASSTPTSTGLRIARAVALITGGLLVVFAGDAVLAVLLTLLSLALLAGGIGAILRLTDDADARARRRRRPAGTAHRVRGRSR